MQQTFSEIIATLQWPPFARNLAEQCQVGTTDGFDNFSAVRLDFFRKRIVEEIVEFIEGFHLDREPACIELLNEELMRMQIG